MSFRGMEILLRTAYSPSSGYGHDGLHLTEALLDEGAEMHIDPTSVGVPIPMRCAMLLSQPRPRQFDYVIQHADPMTLLSPQPLSRISDRHIAWTMWEFTGFEGEPFEHTLRQQLENFDTVISYDDLTKASLDPYLNGQKSVVIQGGYQAAAWAPRGDDPERKWDDTFRFAMVGALNARKNPMAAIRAFSMLKAEHGDDFDAELHLKTNTTGLLPVLEQSNPGVRIHLNTWTHAQMRRFYSTMHCYVAPSWGEGKNVPALEAQTMGVSAIVSDCSGHRQWADPEWNWIVGGSMEEHNILKPGQKSLRVDEDALAAAMWEAYTDRGLAQHKADLAKRMIPSQCSWEQVLRRLDAYLTS